MWTEDSFRKRATDRGLLTDDCRQGNYRQRILRRVGCRQESLNRGDCGQRVADREL
jgi:hypothetical protein